MTTHKFNNCAQSAVLFSDVVGTMIDFTTFRLEPSVTEAITLLKGLHVTVVPVTSKPAPEIIELRKRLDLSGPAIVESGGALIDPGGSEKVLGPPRDDLVAALHQLQQDGWPIEGLSEMNAEEVSERTGIPVESAAHDIRRVSSEAFLAEPGATLSEPDLRRAIDEMDLQLVRGGRLWHIVGRGLDKGFAVRTLRREYPQWCGGRSGAVGDAWNDLAMLAEVDHPFLLGYKVPEDDVDFPVTRVPNDGPAGFARAASLFIESLNNNGAG